jgi:hypothetical protein
MFDAATLAAQSVRRDPQLPALLTFQPELAWPAVASNGMALDLANSFLVVAGDGDESRSNRGILAWHFSTERRPCICKVTTFLKNANGSIDLNYKPLSPEPRLSGEAELLRFSISDSIPYVIGRPLSEELN